MVLTMRVEPDIAHKNDVIISTGVFKSSAKFSLRILIVATKHFVIGLDDAGGCIDKPFTLNILTDPLK